MKKMNYLKQLLANPTITQTKFFASVAIVFFTITGCQKALAQNGNLSISAAIENIDQLTGISEDVLRTKNVKSTETQQFPQDRDRMFFLYNVKTGLLLNAGGYWGTHVSLKENGMPLWVHLENDNTTTGYIHFAQEFDKTGVLETNLEGNYLEYEIGDNSEDEGVFVDRLYNSSSGTIVKRGWQLEAVTGKTNIYRLYTYKPDNKGGFENTKYYLIAFDQQGDVDKNCGAVEENSDDRHSASSATETGNDEWKIISYEQIFNLQDEKTAKLDKSLDLTFRLQNPGFDRENAALANWKTSKYGGNGNIRFGLEHYYKTATANGSTYKDDFTDKTISSYSFTVGDNEEYNFTSANDYERHCGKYFAADIKNAHGAIYQDVAVAHGGTYIVECKGFSTTDQAKLFAVAVTKETGTDGKETVNNVPNTLHMTVLGQTRYMSDQEKTNLHIEEQNMDYAAKEFYGSHKYISSVLVQVPEGGGIIRFGIQVGTHDDATPNESDKEWTVFDDFRLLYASNVTDGDLVLDADRDNLDYLKNCTNTYKNVTLHLNKKFTKDKWNGFILPVDLTRDQMTQAFGPNVRLAMLKEVTNTKIRFESVPVTEKGNDEVVMQAYIPYIIFPTKQLEEEYSPAYTARLTKTGSDQEHEIEKVTIKKNHIDIPNVSMATTGENENIINDLRKMNTSDWTTNSTMMVNAETGSPIVANNNTMTAYGTFARTFAPTQEGSNYQNLTDTDANYGEWVLNSRTIIDGRADLKGSYFYDDGQMYYSKDRARGLRGFSIWFTPTNTTSPANAKIYLDDVTLDETTDISQLIYGETSNKVERFTNGIYSLQGQLVRSNASSTEGLPSGIYIVNGKKVAIK